jgi:hypothetical protein
VDLTPRFKLVFVSLRCLTLVSLGVSVALVFSPNPSDDTRRLVETCSTTFKMGFGAVVGLLGGKTL